MNPQQPQSPQPSSPQNDDATIANQQQPVAYDNQGRPLYAAPPQPQPVHFHRAISPTKLDISPEVQAKHDESVKRYPFLNLSDAEYVISAVRRHTIGMFAPIASTTFLVALVLSILVNYPAIATSYGIVDDSMYGLVMIIGFSLITLFLIGCYISVWVFKQNKFFLTNESVIQEIQFSIFSKHEQTVSLANVEDASFRQQGVLQMMFNYGSIRLSTEGDETTYRFNYVANPKEQIAVLNNAVEAFKNGHPLAND